MCEPRGAFTLHSGVESSAETRGAWCCRVVLVLLVRVSWAGSQCWTHWSLWCPLVCMRYTPAAWWSSRCKVSGFIMSFGSVRKISREAAVALTGLTPHVNLTMDYTNLVGRGNKKKTTTSYRQTSTFTCSLPSCRVFLLHVAVGEFLYWFHTCISSHTAKWQASVCFSSCDILQHMLEKSLEPDPFLLTLL